MSERDMERMKKEIMRSYIWLKTSDGSVHEVEEEFAMYCPIIWLGLQSGLGYFKMRPICLPQNVSPAILSLILDYYRFHRAPGRRVKFMKKNFIKMEPNKLSELASAAQSLQLTCLVSLTSCAPAYIWLKTSDGSVHQVEVEFAKFCPTILQDFLNGLGSSQMRPVYLPQNVSPAMLSLILDYYRFHQAPGRSDKERKTHDKKFIKMDTNKLSELASAAQSLQLKRLVDLTSGAPACIIEGKSPQEIRDKFHIPDHLTDRTEDKNKLKDQRSIDELLSFINGGNKDSQGVGSSKSKKKNKQTEKDQNNKKPCMDVVSISHDEDQNPSSGGGSVEVENSFVPNCIDSEILPPSNHDDVGDDSDEIDPAFDRETESLLEELRRKLDWTPKRC